MREMKDSGIEWIGEIPVGWKICRFKNVARLFTGNSIKDNEKDLYLDDKDARSYISTKDIDKTFSTIDYQNGLYIKNNNKNFRVAPKNSVLMCIEGGSAGVKKAKLDCDVSFVNKLCCFDGFDIKNEYLYFFLSSPNYEESFKQNISGLIGGISVQNLKNFNIIIPDIEEQQLIADFLDEKCDEIDSLTKDIQEQIETLQEYKKSIITEAVIKGLDHDVEMKDSGVEWIGEIPKKWKCIPIKYIFNVISGSTPDSSNPILWDGDIRWITPADYKTDDVYVSNGKRNISEIGYKSCSTHLLPIGSIVMSKRAPIGSVAITKNNLCTNQGCLGLTNKNKKVVNKYFYYVLSISEKTLNLFGSGTTFKEISATVFSNMLLPFPCYNEQQVIVNYLDNKCSQIDQIIQDKQQQIDSLAEYKKSIIYEYVTGKKEVQNV